MPLEFGWREAHLCVPMRPPADRTMRLMTVTTDMSRRQRAPARRLYGTAYRVHRPWRAWIVLTLAAGSATSCGGDSGASRQYTFHGDDWETLETLAGVGI